MEFLNNIWIAINTPNETLVNIILIFASFIENYITMIFFLTLLKTQTTAKQKILYTLLVPIIATIGLTITPNPINIFLNYLIMIILAIFIFKISFFKSIISIVLSAVLYALVGTLIVNPFLTILNISSTQLTIVPIYRILYLFVVYLSIGVIIYILKHKSFNFTFLDNLDKKTKFIIFENIILGLFTLAVQLIITIYYTDTLPITITFLSFISLLLYFLISIYSLTRVFKLVLTTKKLEIAEEYNNTLHILHDNVRGFKQDFDNIVTTIGGYIKTNDMKGLKKYYIELEDDCERVNNLYILNPDIVNNDGIYNLLTKKYYEADSKDIKVNITFLLDLSTLNMKVYEFARILGIFLDNAIEASSECNEKIINLTFRNDCKNSRQLIIVENTYKNKDIDTEKIFEKGITEKENHTGLGLWEVRKILKKNSNTNLHTSKTDKFFTQQLEIYY